MDFEDIKFPVKIKDIHKFEIKQTILLVLVFLVMKIKKKYPIYVSKKCFEMLWSYIASLKKIFCHLCLQAFSLEKLFKHYVKDCFKINGYA